MNGSASESVSSAVKFSKSLVRTLDGSANNADLTRTTAHLFNLLPVDVRADHIGWSTTPRAVADKSRYEDVTAILPDGGPLLIEAEPASGFNHHAREQVSDLAEEANRLWVITTPDAVEEGAEYFAGLDGNIKVMDPFTAFGKLGGSLVGMGVGYAADGVGRVVGGAVGTMAGLPAPVAYALAIMTGVLGRKLAMRVYDRHLKTHVQSLVTHAGKKSKGLLGWLKDKVSRTVSKAKKAVTTLAEQLTNTAKRAWEAVKDVFRSPNGSPSGLAV
jgi:hypothetical protein